MTRKHSTATNPELTAVEYLADDREFVKQVVQDALNTVMEAEMTEFLGADKSERTATRRGYRSGYYSRDLTIMAGDIELRVPQERSGKFSTKVFQRHRRSEKALVATLAEMYVQGVSTRKVGQLAEQLCGREFSAATISSMVAELDASLKAFAERPLEDAYPYVVLDARYEKVREEGSVRSRAVQIALGIDARGRRHILGVELAVGESESSWSEFLSGLKERGLRDVEYVVSDSHEGLRRAIAKVLPTAAWQRCSVHFMRHAVAKVPRRVDPTCLDGLKRLWGHATAAEAWDALRVWIERWSGVSGCARLVDWVEAHAGETLTVYRLPAGHRHRMKSTNMLERFNAEIRRRTRVIRIFPHAPACLRLVRALASETHEHWLTGQAYLNGEVGVERAAGSVVAVRQAAG